MNYKRILTSVLTIAAFSLGNGFAQEIEEDEQATQASIRQVQADLSSSARVPAALAVVEGTVEGGRARAGFELQFSRAKLHLRLDTAFTDVEETEFITLERLPGDANIQANISFELSRESPESLQNICAKLNNEVHESFDRARNKEHEVVPRSLSKEPTRDELYAYVQDLEAQLEERGGVWTGRVNKAENAVVEALCLDWNKQHPASSPLLPEFFGVRDLKQQPAKGLCASSALEQDIAERFKTASLCSALALNERASMEGSIQDLGAALKSYFTDEELLSLVRGDLRQAVEASQCAAVEDASAGFREAVSQGLRKINASLTPKDQEAHIDDIESELVRSSTPPWKIPDLLTARFRLACPEKPEGPSPIPGMPPRIQTSSDDSGCKDKARTAAEAAFKKWREGYNLTFNRELRENLSPILPDRVKDDLDALVRVGEAGSSKASEEFLKTLLDKLRAALNPVAEEFNTYPVAKLIPIGKASCRYEVIEKEFNAREPGPERNKLFRAISKNLPSVSYFTIIAETAAKDFSWLQSFPPVLDTDNQVALTKDRKYNYGAGVSYTLFRNGWTYDGTLEEREVFDAARSVDVCVNLPGGSSTVCRTAALTEPTDKEERVLSIGAKYFFTPTLATRLFTSYEIKESTFNPHLFLYFIPEKGVLRGGFDLSYVRNHPELGNQFQARLFFGVPLTFGPDTTSKN